MTESKCYLMSASPTYEDMTCKHTSNSRNSLRFAEVFTCTFKENSDQINAQIVVSTAYCCDHQNVTIHNRNHEMKEGGKMAFMDDYMRHTAQMLNKVRMSRHPKITFSPTPLIVVPCKS